MNCLDETMEAMSNTVIGKGIVIDGEVCSEGNVEIHGTVKGRIDAKGQVLVAAGAVVQARVQAQTMCISGAVTGDLRAQDGIELCGASSVVGDVKAPRIQIAKGASFRGNAQMGD